MGWAVPGVVALRESRESVDSVGRRVVGRRRISRESLMITYLSADLCADGEFRARFARDFARVARLRDARIARVHRYCESSQGGAVISEHVSGTSLRTLLLAHGAVGIEAALVVLKDALRGLAACHEAGLAHGDIMPRSVIVTPTGQVRLVDFGLWSASGRRLLARSTPFYLAPEQWSGATATPAGDVYSATVTFFECLAGAPPFYADSEAELWAKHDQSALPVEVLPEPVRELVARGLAKDPSGRPEARGLLAQVAQVASGALGAGWEQRGRLALSALLARPWVLPEPVRRGDDAGWGHRRPIRLAAVMGGALALAAGLASPPLAVIMPVGSIFASGGSSPVLAFPDPVPVRVATNGQLADRAMNPATKAVGSKLGARPVAKARPSALPTSALKSPTGLSTHAVSDPRQRGTTHPDAAQNQDTPSQGASDQDTLEQATPTPTACTRELNSAHISCAGASSERPDPDSVEWTSDLSQDLSHNLFHKLSQDPAPLAAQLAAQLVAPTEEPVELPVPVQSLEPILIRTKIQPQLDTDIPPGP
ncbi:MAG: serine/threonine protein kinase [Pseudonocardiaceae bacterium]